VRPGLPGTACRALIYRLARHITDFRHENRDETGVIMTKFREKSGAGTAATLRGAANPAAAPPWEAGQGTGEHPRGELAA
jgi:hypothetical protein